MSVLNAESALALLDEDGDMRSWSSLRYYDSTGRGCSLMLLAVNALAYSLSLTDPTIKSCAAGVYTTRHDKGEKLTILVSGSGPIPTATQKIAKRIAASLTATANASPSPPSSTPVADLFAEITLNALDEWRRRAYVDDQDVWDGRIDSLRQGMSGDNLASFTAVIEQLQAIKDYASTSRIPKSLDDVRESLRTELFSACCALDKLLQNEHHRRLLVFGADWMVLEMATSLRLLKLGAPVLDDRSAVEDSEGRLRKDFSIVYSALNLLGLYRCAVYLSTVVKRRRQYFSGDGPQIVFCSSLARNVAIDAEGAKLALSANNRILSTRPETSVHGFLHAVPNLLEQLLLVTSRSSRAVIVPVIGTSAPVCVGCDACLQAYNTSYSESTRHMSRRWPNIKFEYPGRSGVFTFPWLSPDLRGSYKPLHEYLQTQMVANIVREICEAWVGP